ncbi:ABC transporter substrate-binding protein [Aeromicrobium yanjiei]|uniref:ABC transporter substrate-binding protein n=2 Tax=Aeromicrobium yanjiei TaxID=2662028 RepID=A0A5Q2MGQ1_9ACTN|nr:ABC transporter substrate-binding protein [Aeromicrobium yanjiei]
MFGPSCEALAALAAKRLNAEGGLLGRAVELHVLDGGKAPSEVAHEVKALLDVGGIDGVTGWHISAVRKRLAPMLSGRAPYVYTALYEGGETTTGVFCSGETPRTQIAPALRWLRDNENLRRWCIVGDDYVWPRESAAATVSFARSLGLEIADEVYVPFGTCDFSSAMRRVKESDADGVLMLLVGQDAVLFNRLFAQQGLDHRMTRFSPLMEENMLLASGPGSTRRLYVAASYFRSLATAGAMDLTSDYVSTFSADAPPLNNMAESCYEGVQTIAALVRRAKSFDLRRILSVSECVGFDSPRGVMQMRNSHLDHPIYLAAASDYEFDVITSL